MTAPMPLVPVGFGINPTALTGYHELVPYAGQTILVVGCGRTHAHSITNYDHVHHTNLPIAAANAYTIDISGAANPDRIADFWVEDHAEDLPGHSFNLIFLENLPAGVFANAGRCAGLARTAHRLLVPGGVLIVRTAHALIAAGSPIHAALVQVFGAANVIVALDQHNWATHLRADR